MFTDINAAIEEARFLRRETKRHHCVSQHQDGGLSVHLQRSWKRESKLKRLYYTRYDGLGTVNTEVRV